MARSRELILQALDNLKDEEFERFKLQLLDVDLKKGLKHIPRGTLNSLNRVGLSDKIVSYYTGDYGIELTMRVLQDIGMLEETDRLQQAAGLVSRTPGARDAALPSPPSSAASTPSGKHFVDNHRAALINRVTLLDPILDQLHGNVLQQEQYDAIRAQSPIQNQMRKLYSFVPAWNNACKDQFLDALRATLPSLVEDLEGR
ncbi:apoptosis-associated speck-like protein containing a CARD [Macrotis lagotis]|uniref:apoptosis-associated speck-like protein containing a CARD n=1 Tax=Macrotis lagotis TaxID=92651 RepID=UPI003D696E33